MGSVGCGVFSADPFNMRWSPDGALLSQTAQHCRSDSYRAFPPPSGNLGRREHAIKVTSVVRQCIEQLDIDQRSVWLHASPGGPREHRAEFSGPEGIPVELGRSKDSWIYVRLVSGESGWVSEERLALLYLQ